MQQKTEKDSEEVILNLHTLVRVVARKEFCITEEDKEAFYKSVMGNPIFLWITSNPLPYCCLAEESVSACLQLSDSFRAAAFYMEDLGFEWAYWKSYLVRFELIDGESSSLKDDFISDVMTLIAATKNSPQWFESSEKVPSWRCARFYENLFYGVERFWPGCVCSNVSKRTLWLYLTYGLGRTGNYLNSPILCQADYKNWAQVKNSIYHKAVELWEQQEQPDRSSLKELYLKGGITDKEFSKFKEKALDNLKKCPQADALDYAFFYEEPVARYFRGSKNIEQLQQALQTAHSYEEQYLDQLSTQISELSIRSQYAWESVRRYCKQLIDEKEYEKAAQRISLLERFSVEKADKKCLLTLKIEYYFKTDCFQECLTICKNLRDLCAIYERNKLDDTIIEIYKRMGEPEKALGMMLETAKYKDAIVIAAELYSAIASNNITGYPETAEEKALIYTEQLIEEEKKRIKKAQEKDDCDQLDQAVLRYKQDFIFAVRLHVDHRMNVPNHRDFLVKEIQWVTKTFPVNKNDWTFQQQDLYGELYYRYIVELYNKEKYQKALEVLDEFEAAGLSDLEKVWKPERRRQTRENILKKLNDSLELPLNETLGGVELEELEEQKENLVEAEKDAERAYYSKCRLLEAEASSHDMIEWYDWYIWNTSNSAEEVEDLLLCAVRANWKLEHFDRASNTALSWMEIQPEEFGGWIRARAIWINCLCHQKYYSSAVNQLAEIYLDYKKIIKKISASEEAEEVSECLVAFDSDFWKQWIFELEEILPQNHPILSMAHILIAGIYFNDRRIEKSGMNLWGRIGRFEPAKMYLKALKEILFAFFHNWDSWWEPDT